MAASSSRLDCWLHGETLRYHLLWHTSPIQLLQVWNRLPEEYKCDLEIKKRLPCLQHSSTAEDQPDGPPRAIGDCRLCQYGNSDAVTFPNHIWSDYVSHSRECNRQFYYIRWRTHVGMEGFCDHHRCFYIIYYKNIQNNAQCTWINVYFFIIIHYNLQHICFIYPAVMWRIETEPAYENFITTFLQNLFDQVSILIASTLELLFVESTLDGVLASVLQ